MRKESDRVIAVKGVSKRVVDASGELAILDDIGMHVDAGETVAIVGESGSGKSTLLGLLAGLDTASSGTIHLLGQELGALDEDARAALRARGVGFVFQAFQLMPHLTALENVMLPLELRGDVSRRQAREQAHALLERVGLGSRVSHYPRVLSGGEQQRVALARAFVTQPAVLFADEPTGSLDAATGEAVSALMFEMNRSHGATLVLVTHDLSLARRCDRVITMRAGRLAEAA
ncbi:ABC transporter ATP-binding protein [Robbsia sp. KACC 23696]|uniref:ABC transporter ATP-binding protein n=1 Tax=Robbsia sp. KACC 23696 TaxID=3149231 RepID=UPI00325BF705